MKNVEANEVLERLYEDDSQLVRLTCDTTVELSSISTTKEGDIEIKGWFVTENLIKSRNLIVKASAFSGPDGLSRFNGRVLSFHDDRTEPVGRTTEFKIQPGKGIRGSCLIFRECGEQFKRSIREGVLAAFSIGFSVDEYTYDKKKDIVTVTKAQLKEVSIVNIGADPHALFSVRMSGANDSTETNKQTKFTIIEEHTLGDKNTNFDAEKMIGEQELLGGKVENLSNVLDEIRETQTKLANSSITKDEFSSRLELMATELETVRKELTTAKAAKTIDDQKLAFKDYRSLITEFIWLTDDDGNKLGNIAQRAYCLFQMPVDYDKMEAGHELRNLRDLHDALLISDAMKRYQDRDRYTVQKNRLFLQLIKATEAFDTEVALAMAGGNSGFGAEWLPVEMSSEFNEFLRKQPRLPNLFPMWNMPKGASARFPFQNGRAVVYKGSEALVDNAEEARKTNIATGVKTFTPCLFIGALVSSEELTEDAILDMIQFIRNELATALLEGLESALINGDDSGTHFDNASAGTDPYVAYNVETCFKGLRKLGISNARDIEVASATTGPGALEITNFTDAKGDLGVAGLTPADCVYVTGIKGRKQVQNALYKEDALGILAFIISGQLPTIDGSEIYISGQYDEQLASDGVRDSTDDQDHTSMVCVHKPSFRIAQRRGVTLEFSKNILTQQQQFVATARWDFGKISADAIAPVSEMINIQHTT